MQDPYYYFTSKNVYSPVATHETLPLFFSLVAANNLIFEGADVNNAYPYSRLDVPIFMKQPTDFSQRLMNPDSVWMFFMSLYGARQAGMLWESVIDTNLRAWGFTGLNFDQHMYSLREDMSYIVLLLVDDMECAYNNRFLLDKVKTTINKTFYIQLYGDLEAFTVWSPSRSNEGLKLGQKKYAVCFLHCFDSIGETPYLLHYHEHRAISRETSPFNATSPLLPFSHRCNIIYAHPHQTLLIVHSVLHFSTTAWLIWASSEHGQMPFELHILDVG